MNRSIVALLVLLVSIPSFLFGQDIDPKNVTIARDSFGVPHIFAATDAEAAYGLAWAHCEDDFENIQYAMLGGKGMLGRVQGKDGVLFDLALQFLEVDSLVDARYETDLSPAFRKVLAGYVQALNDFAAAHPKQVLFKKGFPVEPKDVIKGYVSSTSLMAGLGLALKAVREDRIAEFMNINDIGSNAVAVAPDKMEDDKGYLMVNSHQPIEGRFAWYEAHVQSDEGWDIIGGLFPGGMSIFVGTNRKLGWAHTTNYHNFGDVYKLEVNPKNKKQYKYDGEWRNFKIKKIKLKVKIAGIKLPVSRKFNYCEYGPVFKTKTGSYAFRFPGYMDIRSAEQWFNMNKAQNLEEFTDALKMQAVPLFNVIYADVDGHILMHSGGRIADRNPDLNWSYPITANTSAYKWESIVPYEKMPTVTDPSCGYVFNANNTPLQASGEGCDWNGYFVGLQQFGYNRGDQFDRMLADIKGKFTVKQLHDIKFNTSYAPNGAYMKHFKKLYELEGTKYPDIADAITKLKQWDLSSEVDNKDAALAMIVHDQLRQKVKGPFAWLMIRDTLVSETDAVWAIAEAKKIMMKTHGSLDVPLGDVQRLIRGDVSYPASGLREVPRAADTKLFDKKKGIYRIVGGDGYIQQVRFSKAGPELETVNAYGASAHPDSKHYTDQMELFSNRKYKTMTFDKDSILSKAINVYHPGEVEYR